MKEYYQILGVGQKATLAEIKKSYRKLARKFHPDLNPNDKEAERRFKEITEAYEVLKDPEKRKQFDTYGRVGADFKKGGNHGPFEGFDFNTTGDASFGDIFETIFGGGFQGQNASAGREQSQTSRGEDLHYSMSLSFLDAVKGLETPIQLTRKVPCQVCGGRGAQPSGSPTRCPTCAGTGKVQKQMGFMKFASPCPTCNGRGTISEKACQSCSGSGRIDSVDRIKVRIPPGVEDGSKLRIPQKGNAGQKGGQSGDLIISITVASHPFFARQQNNLAITLPVTFTEAALGAKVEVPTLDGKAMLKIPPGSASGQKLRLRGKGITDPKTATPGDMVATLKIVPPPTKDLAVRELLKKLEQIAAYNPREDLP
jgi:molecular chaperone DnaJ